MEPRSCAVEKQRRGPLGGDVMANVTPAGERGVELAPSLVRTAIPFLAGLFGTWLLERFGVEVDTATVGALLTAVIGYVYYVVVRFMEVFVSDRWGYVLGFRKKPVYVPPGDTAIVVADVQGRHEGPLRGEGGGVDSYVVGLALVCLALAALVGGLLADSAFCVGCAVVMIVVGVLVVALSGRQRRDEQQHRRAKSSI